MFAAYVALLPRLQAEESLRRVAELQSASAYTKPEDRRRILGAWERQAQAGQEPAPPNEAKLAMMGIHVVKVPSEKAS